MSLMQLPAPNTSAKVIVSFRYATATAMWVIQPNPGRIVIRYSPLLGGLFKLENATTLTF